MEKINYEEVGLKVGLEIHRQLDTKKLFSPVPSKLSDDVDFTFKRRLRPTMSELGEIDPAALEEFKKGRTYIYEANNELGDLVYMDEEPPRGPDEEALEVALQIAYLLNAKPVDEVYYMRKIVIDGSNVSGFQRTAIIATDGKVETPWGTVGIPTICLEEDAARIIETRDREVIYRIDRLGIPLVEISTTPDIHHPEQAKVVAKFIGDALRATRKVKRGLGTIRQDLNVSIKGGARIEIKGVQELDMIPVIIEREVQRQLNLLKIRDELRKRGVTPEDIKEEFYDVTDIFKDTKSKIIARILKKGGKVLAIKLPKFKGLIGMEIQPGRRLGTEFADRAKKYVPGIFHSDELPNYGITQEEVEKVRKLLELEEEDAFVLVAAQEEIAKKALKEVIIRAREAIIGVPEETRRALPDGNTQYMRPLPGKARMYPETDIPPIRITEEMKRRIKENLPELPQAKVEKYVKEFGIDKSMAQTIVDDERDELFEELIEMGVKPSLAASILAVVLKGLRKEVPIENITEEHIKGAFRLYLEGKIAKEAFEEIFKELAQHPEKTAEEVAQEKGLTLLSEEEVRKIVDEVVNQYIDVIKEKGMGAMGLIMGRVMTKVRGKADGKLVSQIVKEKIREISG
ncbi:Glu-tRNA(Gln) amidotransferase GatDE subunit E [Pyrococcus furiosus DSM 3638]|uniref:Glutamyl-tRNA(Gln) amidotransferase subunit E n=3 Tax=Pyrococcus furiosus TaxID=2261 RepID=GATE_PYRFU|nr:Glu-tRNA(Gln) amidotransferase subunit GatE [Pyrococcus furiosus]Q8U0W9.1 RecName: Full=Glutamyl-tRNA(Gln) amidotransferase subunit E; Short=Glu-ADT subunit E [Pyrococcus furiosus DSM 3638]AAL81586.1 pet112-like protein [Pyrococcus furiosus DSM 3638]AFN04246.1 glutamyl-tRNA(Gln) amidotransferase subunit E [Pyrococcus furiosus COM1]QEK79092.1 Glu-tRNA(Gln) amidotransferase GatDE subunit E [Pyrococcus furiosus DSM 3638]